MSDPTEFGSSDESIEVDYIDYLDEFHPQLSNEDISEIESLQTDSLEVFQPLDFDNDDINI
jgi:hypothetical protein